MVSESVPFDTARHPYDKVFGSFPGEIKIGSVTSIEQGHDVGRPGEKKGMIVIDGKQKLFYDIAILATGSSWKSHLNFPGSDAGFEEHVQTWRKKIKDANNIVIAGGGAVGIGALHSLTYNLPPTHLTMKHLQN